MDLEEMTKIAEEIARDEGAYPSARVTALRFLRELSESGEELARSRFEDLDSVADLRNYRTKKAS